MSVEFVISLKSFYDSGLLVSNCSFHPHEPVLACAVQHGRVCLYDQDVAAVGSIVPLSKWKETILNPVSTQYPVSNASCLQWDVSCYFIAIWECNLINLLHLIRRYLMMCSLYRLNFFFSITKGGWKAISSWLRKWNADPLESRRMSFIREEKAHGRNWQYSLESNPAQYLRQRKQWQGNKSLANGSLARDHPRRMNVIWLFHYILFSSSFLPKVGPCLGCWQETVASRWAIRGTRRS